VPTSDLARRGALIGSKNAHHYKAYGSHTTVPTSSKRLGFLRDRRRQALRLFVPVAALIASLVGITFSLLQTSESENPHIENPHIDIVGAPEKIFDWSRDACEFEDIPDSPARAFRDYRGKVVLIASTTVTRRMIGRSVNRLQHSCRGVMSSNKVSRPEQFDDREWITATFTHDGRKVFALIHEEYQGHTHRGRCAFGTYFSCWYNAITFAISKDGGQTFENGLRPPEHLVASVPYRYAANTGPYGLFQPSNILLRRDGYYYVLIRAQAYGKQQGGVCAIRTRTIGDPSSWRAWDGSNFTVKFVNPYKSARNPNGHLCKPVSHPQIDNMTQSLTFNTYLDQFVLVGTAGKDIPGRKKTVWGVYFSTSNDLIHWSDRKLVMETELPHTHKCGDRSTRMYPSVIDPNSKSRNFDTVGEHAYLYFTRIKYEPGCQQNFDRDLLRVPIIFSK
jgi:hypothetical protein